MKEIASRKPTPFAGKKLRSTRSRRERAQISSFNVVKSPPWRKEVGVSTVSVDSCSDLVFPVDDNVSCGSSIVENSKKKNRVEEVEVSRPVKFVKETIGDSNFRRITRSYSKLNKEETEVSESSCVESNSGVGLRRLNVKGNDRVEINEKDEVSVTRSDVTFGENVSDGRNLNFASENKESDVVSFVSGVECCSKFGSVSGGGDNEETEISKPSSFVKTDFSLGSVKESKPEPDIVSDLACTEKFSGEEVSVSDYPDDELSSEIFSQYSDVDFSDYTPSIFLDSGSEFSEKSCDSPTSLSRSLFLQFKEQFCRSTIPNDLKSSEENREAQAELLRFDDEEVEESYQRLRERERSHAYLRDCAKEYCSSMDHTDFIPRLRLIMVQWIVEQCSLMELQPETLFLGVSLLDRFLSKGSFKNERILILVGIARLTLATRIEENQPYNSIRQKNFYIRNLKYSRHEVPVTTLLLLIGALIFSGAGYVKSDASDHRYKEGDTVPLYAYKVGPYHNPIETYRYFDLPFCAPEGVKEKKETLGEILSGDRLVTAPFKLNFRDDKESKVYCRKKLTKEEVKQFRKAIEEDFFFQMYYDDLPIWGFIGKVDKGDFASAPSEYKYFLYKHIRFEILYNKDRVIDIYAAPYHHSLVNLTEDKEADADFIYSVKWKETDIPYEKRLERYTKLSSLRNQLEIRWFSTINSCVIVLLLTGFLATILMRVLKNDFMKYSQDEEAADDLEETGWKNIHGDVFRFPTHSSLFPACLGVGTQLFMLTVFIFMLALVGVFYPYNRGALLTALVVIYALTSGIAGYTSASFYCQLEGKIWVRNLLLTGCLFCGPLFLTFCFLNTVAITYTATAALPFGTIVVIVLVWTLVALPLLVLGGIVGKNSKSEFQAPCRTTKLPREIPPLPWYRSAAPQMAMAGFLPFSAIYIELYYISASVWGHRIYTSYGLLFVVFIILIIVTAFITVALTYFQLAAEDHQWWWRSFLCGGSTGLFIYAYCLYYYYTRSDMSGFMQISFFFGYMACICYGSLDANKPF